MNKNFSITASLITAVALTFGLSGCGSKTPPSSSSSKPAATSSADQTPATVDIKGKYNNGSMWAKVGPIYRQEDGTSVLALTAGYSKEVTGWPANANVGQAITSVNHAEQIAYSGIFMLNDSEVFEPLRMKNNQVAWVPQDAKLKKEQMHSFKEQQKGELKESVLVPFGDIGKGAKAAGVLVGLIGFAANVPVLDSAQTPPAVQAALGKIPQDAQINIHAPYSQYTMTPGMGISSGKEKLDVTLTADVFFDSGKWDIKPDSKSVLDQAAAALATHEPGEVTIVGHTDDVPDKNVGNQVLSENRANAVKAVLAGKSELSGFTFKASGKAATQPAVPGTTPEARAKNRRVEVSIKTPVKKEVAELQAASAKMPAAAGSESTWPAAVAYDADSTGTKPVTMEISASEAMSYPNYTLVTFTVTAKDVPMWLTRLQFEPNYHGAPNGSNKFYGADILRGQARTAPLEYARPLQGGTEQAVITGGGVHGAGTSIKPGYKLTIPVLYPPTKDQTITIDATYHNPLANKKDLGWRIKDIPVKPATTGDK